MGNQCEAALHPRRVQGGARVALVLSALSAAWALAGCSSLPTVPAVPPVAAPEAAASATGTQPLKADTPTLTNRGNRFVAPAEWTLVRRGDLTVLAAPEPGARIGLIDVDEPDAQAAVDVAWRAFDPTMRRALKVRTPAGPRDGWRQRATLDYLTSPSEHRAVEAYVRHANGLWTVILVDMGLDVYEKRSTQIGVLFGRLLPKDYTRESFAGRSAQPLDGTRQALLRRHLRAAMAATQVPGVSFGVVQNGRVVMAEGLGVRALGSAEPVDADTRYLVASNTKGLVTLMLAKLVDQGRFTWDTPAVQVMPGFRLGDAATTAQVRIKHLICACTGVPRQDLEWLFEFENATPETALQTLATMQPTSAFGQLFQYSNPMAAAAGYLGGQVAHPGLALGPAYDRAMAELVFAPLGMTSTTHDFDLAERGNAAAPHAPDVDGRMTAAEGRINRSIIHVRPAAGAWSTVTDMLKYVQMELDEGLLPDGRRYISREALLARRVPQVRSSTDVAYGMGLSINTVYGTPVIHHGGDMIGFHSDMIWLPEHNVGAVVLTNGGPGWLVRSQFRRKLLELLFDGRPEADEGVAADAEAFYLSLKAERGRFEAPADAGAAQTLAQRYHHPAIGSVTVIRDGSRTVFDFGEWRGEVASRRNPDGSTSFITITPGFNDAEFLVGTQDGQRTLTVRDGQHQYVMREQPARP